MSKPQAKRRYRRRRAARKLLQRHPWLEHLPLMRGYVKERRDRAVARALAQGAPVATMKTGTRISAAALDAFRSSFWSQLPPATCATCGKPGVIYCDEHTPF